MPSHPVLEIRDYLYALVCQKRAELPHDSQEAIQLCVVSLESIMVENDRTLKASRGRDEAKRLLAAQQRVSSKRAAISEISACCGVLYKAWDAIKANNLGLMVELLGQVEKLVIPEHPPEIECGREKVECEELRKALAGLPARNAAEVEPINRPKPCPEPDIPNVLPPGETEAAFKLQKKGPQDADFKDYGEDRRVEADKKFKDEERARREKQKRDEEKAAEKLKKLNEDCMKADKKNEAAKEEKGKLKKRIKKLSAECGDREYRLQEAENKLRKVKESAESEEKRLRGCERQNVNVTKKLEELVKVHMDAKKEYEALKEKLAELKGEVKKSQQDLELNQSRALQESEQRKRAAELQKKDLAQQLENLKHSRAEQDRLCQVASAKEAQLQNSLKLHKQELSQLERDLETRKDLARKAERLPADHKVLEDKIEDDKKRYSDIKAEIREYTEEANALRAEQTKLKDEVGSLKQQNATLTSDNLWRKSENTSRKAELESLSAKVKALLQTKASLTASVTALSAEKERLGNCVGSLRETLGHAKDVSADIIRSKKEVQIFRADITKDNTRLKVFCENVMERAKQTQQELMRLRAENSRLVTENAAEEQRLSQAKEDVLRLQGEEEKLKECIAELRGDCEKERNEYDRQVKATQKAREGLGRLKANCDRFRRETLSSWETVLKEALSRMFANTKEGLDEVAAKVRAVSSRIKDMKTEKARLQNEVSHLTGELNGIKNATKQAEERSKVVTADCVQKTNEVVVLATKKEEIKRKLQEDANSLKALRQEITQFMQQQQDDLKAKEEVRELFRTLLAKEKLHLKSVQSEIYASACKELSARSDALTSRVELELIRLKACMKKLRLLPVLPSLRNFAQICDRPGRTVPEAICCAILTRMMTSQFEKQGN